MDKGIAVSLSKHLIERGLVNRVNHSDIVKPAACEGGMPDR